MEEAPLSGNGLFGQVIELLLTELTLNFVDTILF